MSLMNYTYCYEPDEDYIADVVLNLNEDIKNVVLERLFSFLSMMGASLYGMYDRKGRIVAYAMEPDLCRKVFALKRCCHLRECRHGGSDDLIRMNVIDEAFIEKLYNDENRGLQACMAQLAIFPSDQRIIAKCKARVETYIIPKVAIELARECVIEPQKNIIDYRVDGVFIIRDQSACSMPDICLELDEDGHRRYDTQKERERENFIKSFGHKIVRVSVKRNATDDEMQKAIKDTVQAIRILIKDIRSQYAMDLMEEDFLKKKSR